MTKYDEEYFDLEKFKFDENLELEADAEFDDDDDDDDEFDDDEFEEDFESQQSTAESAEDFSANSRVEELNHANEANSEKEPAAAMMADNTTMADYILNNLDLVLKCEIGQIKVSINDLLNFKAGELLNFSSDLQQVKIIINSTLIGFGQLVLVDGKYGIKVSKVLSITDSLSFC